jgi:protein-tyrosine kinase
MSLIESGLRKVQEAARRQNETARHAAPSTPSMPLPVDVPGVVSHEPPKVYRSCSLDLSIMEQHLVLPQISDDVALSAYKILRTRLLQRLATNHWQSVAVTGTQAQQGKTLTAVNLAIALAQDPDTSVFLVDLDLRRPKVASTLGMRFDLGLSDYLSGDLDPAQIIYETGISRLAVVPNGKPRENSSELLLSRKMADLLSYLSASAPRRIIVYDMPPLLFSDDVIGFAPRVDGLLLVATEGLTTRASLESAREVLREMNLIGVILNRSAERSDSYYY